MSDMIEVNVKELEGAALDWAVAMADGHEAVRPKDGQTIKRLSDIHSCHYLCGPQPAETKPYEFSPSTNWAHGGPLIEEFSPLFTMRNGSFLASVVEGEGEGPTHLIAAMRAIARLKLGETVQVPRELMS